MMRIATYNVNNLFQRARVLDLEGFSVESREVLNDIAALNALLEEPSYLGAIGAEILSLLEKYLGKKKKFKTEYFNIVMAKEKLYAVDKATGKLKLKVAGRDEWLGWVELSLGTVNEAATQNTARVIREVNADVLCCVEVENRITLERFNEVLLNKQYKYSYVIDGNDERGIDVGLLSNTEATNIETHVFDSYTSKKREYRIFSRDCALYSVRKGNHTVHVYCNHLKSKGYGKPADSNAKRKRQAERIAEILQTRDLKKEYVVVAGDLNDTPTSAPLAPLLKHPDLVNIITQFGSTNIGTYERSKDQFDYLLVSTALAKKFLQGGIERRGIYNKKGGCFPTVTSPANQASDHAAVWADFDL